MLEGLRLLVDDLHDALADLGRDLARVEVDDLVLDRLVAEEALHRDPRGVEVAHQPQHALEHVADRLGRHLERADLVEVVGLDAAHRRLGRLEHRLDAGELLLDAALAPVHLLLLDAELLLQLLHLGLALDGLLHRLLDVLHRDVGLLLLGRQQRALLDGRLRELVDLDRRLVQLVEAALEVLDALRRLGALPREDLLPHLEERHVHARRRAAGRAHVARDRRGARRVVDGHHRLDDRRAPLGLEVLLGDVVEELGGQLVHRRVVPRAHPHHRAARVQRRVGLAAHQEAVVGVVHAERHVQVALDARDEEVEERAVLEAVLPHLLLERREQRLELLRLEEARDLAAREDRVDALDERVAAQLVVLEQQADRRALHARLGQDRLELGAERLERVVAHHRRRDELDAVHEADERQQRAPPHARRAHQQQVAARHREHALHAHDVGERLGEEDQVELLDLALEPLELAEHLGVVVAERRALQRERAVGRRADALRRADEQRRVRDAVGLDGGVEVRAERRRDDVVEARAVLARDEPVAQLARPLEGPHVEERRALVLQLVPQQPLEPRREVARREEVVALLVDGELLAHRLVHVDHARRELLGGARVVPRRRALALPREHRREQRRVDRVERVLVGVRDVREAHVGGEARRERVAADVARRVHRRDDVDVLEPDEVEVLVVEAAVGRDLLQEGDELGGVVLVGLGQVDVLQVEHDARRVLGPVDAPLLRARHGARLRELVDDVRRERLRRAVHHGHLRAARAREHLGEQHVLAGALGPHQDERLHPLHPRLEHVLVALHRRRAHHRALVRRELVEGDRDLLVGVQVVLGHRLVVEAVERAAVVGGRLVGPRVEQPRQLGALLGVEVGAEAAHRRARELGLGRDADEVRERAVHDARLGRLDDARRGVLGREHPLERLEEEVVDPALQLGLQLLGLAADPRRDDAVDVGRLLVEEDHPHPRDGRGRRELEVVRLEDEVDVGAELDALARRHREQPVVVEHRVERLDPLGVDVAVADDPRLDLGRLAHHLARRRRQHAVEPLARVHVHVAEQLLARHRLRVHHVRRDLLAELGERRLEHLPDRRLAAAARPHHHDAHPLLARLVELQDLAHLQRQRLELLLLQHLPDRRLELLVRHVGHRRAREDVADQRVERRRVRVGELRERVDAQRLDEHRLLELRRELALLLLLVDELPAVAQHRLERAQPPVVVLLPREQLLRELEDRHQLDRERLGGGEALRVHHHLRDQLDVGLGHGHRAEERRQVVGQLRAAAVALARRVHRDEDAGVRVDVGGGAVDLAARLLALDRVLDDLDRLRDLRELVGQQPVELVEAAPRAALDEADEDPPHRLGVDALVAVEDEHLPAEGAAERLDRLGLAGAGRAVRVAAVAHEHRLRERQVALVGERRVHELARVALVLVRVRELGRDHPHLDGLLLGEVVAQLLAPRPVGGRRRVGGELLVDDVDVVDQVHHERLHLEREQLDVGLVRRVLLELAEQLLLERVEAAAAAPQRRLAVARERDDLGDAQHLRRRPLEVEAGGGERVGDVLLQRRLHLRREKLQPRLDGVRDRHRLEQRHDLALERAHRRDRRVALRELHLRDAGEELLEVRLDDDGVLGLAEDLEQVVVADEVEAREALPLLLEEVGERLLAALELVEDRRERRLEVGHLGEREDARVVADAEHDRAEVLVDALEARLLVRHRAAAEDRLEVDPLALDRVELRERAVEHRQLRRVLVDLVGEAAEERALLERAEQRLQVAHLRREVLPVLDERRLAAVLVVLGQAEGRLLRPVAHLLHGLADGHLALRARVERAHLLGVVGERLRRLEEVREAELVDLERRVEPQLAHERRPVLGLEGLAAHEAQQRRDVAEARQLVAQVVGDGAGRARLRLLAPARDEVVKLPQPLPERDPVLLGEGVELGHVPLEDGARRDVRLDVGLDVLEADQLRRRDREVLAVEHELLRRRRDLLELGLPLLDARDHLHHLVAVVGLELLRLELEPARRELLHRALQLGDTPRHLAAQVRHLVLDPVVEGVERQLELLPARRERRQLEAAARDRAHHARELLETLELGLDRVLAVEDARPLALRRADLVDRLRPPRERLHRLVDEVVDLLLPRRRHPPHPEEQRVGRLLVLVLERRLERRERDGEAVDLLEVGQLLGLLALGLERLERRLEGRRLGALLLDEVVERALVEAEEQVRLVLGEDGLELLEELRRLLVHDLQRAQVAVGHVAEDLEHLVLAARALLEVAEALEGRRDRDELLDLAVELGAQLLERRPQLQPPVLELEVALDLRQVLVEPLEARLVLVLEHLEELHVPVHPPPLHPRVVRLQPVDGRAQRLDALLPLGLLPEQAHVHQLRHLLAHHRVHLPQLAVLLREPLGRRVQLADVRLELVGVGPRDDLAAALAALVGRRLGARVGGEVLELQRKVEQQRLLRAHDLRVDVVVEVRDLLEHDAVPVEAVRDVGVPLHRLGHLEAHRRQLAHLAQEAHEPVRVVDLEREVLLGDLEQLARQLHREAGAVVLQLALDHLDPLGVLLLRVVVEVDVQLLRAREEARHPLQVVQQRLGCREHLAHLVLQLPRQHHLRDHLGHVLARRLAAAAAAAAAAGRCDAADAVDLAGARLEVLAQHLELPLHLAEQPLARRRQLGEDRRAQHELLVAERVAQQRVPLEPRRREARVQLARDVALDRRHQPHVLGRGGVPRRARVRRVVQRRERLKRREDLVGVQLGHLALREQPEQLVLHRAHREDLVQPLLQPAEQLVVEAAALPRADPELRRQRRRRRRPRVAERNRLAQRGAHLAERVAPHLELAERLLRVPVERRADDAHQVHHARLVEAHPVQPVEHVLHLLQQLLELGGRQLREARQPLGHRPEHRPELLGAPAHLGGARPARRGAVAHRVEPPVLALVGRRHDARDVLLGGAGAAALHRRREPRLELLEVGRRLGIELRMRQERRGTHGGSRERERERETGRHSGGTGVRQECGVVMGFGRHGARGQRARWHAVPSVRLALTWPDCSSTGP